jgi:hypothetical protein
MRVVSAFADLRLCFDGDAERKSVVEVKTQEGVSHRSLFPVGHEKIHRSKMRDEKLAFFESHCEIIRAAVFESRNPVMRTRSLSMVGPAHH